MRPHLCVLCVLCAFASLRLILTSGRKSIASGKRAFALCTRIDVLRSAEALPLLCNLIAKLKGGGYASA